MKRILLISVLVSALTANATDGVIEINHARALAGGVTAGDNAGYPVTISQPGSYRLTGNLTVPDEQTDGIVVTVDGVSIDLNGFAIKGPVVCTGTPVTSCAPAGGAGRGINLQAVGQVSVRNGTVMGMGWHGISGSVRAEGVTANSNGGSGFFSDPITGAWPSVISNSSAARNGANGFSIGGTLSHSSAVGNRGMGASGQTYGEALSVDHGNFSANGSFGISAGSVVNSVVTGNGAGGISSAVVVGNLVKDNQDLGISTTGLAEANTVVNNTGVGLSVNNAHVTMRGNVFTGNNGGGAQTATANGGTIYNAGGNICINAVCP